MRQESLIRLLSQSLFRLREAFERHQTLAVLAGMLPVLGVIVILTRDRTLKFDFRNESGQMIKVLPKDTRILRFVNGPLISNLGKTLADNEPYLFYNGSIRELVIHTPDQLRDFLAKDWKDHEKPKNMNLGDYAGRLLGQCVGQQKGEKWKVMRSHFDPEYSHQASTDMIPIFSKEIDIWTEGLARGPQGNASIGGTSVQDVMHVSKVLALRLIALTMYGEALDEEKYARLMELSLLHGVLTKNAILNLRLTSKWYNMLPITPRFQMNAFQKRWEHFNTDMISHARTKRITCPAERIYKGVEMGQMSKTEYLQTLDEMLFTNIDITGSVLGFIFVNMASKNSFQEKLRAEVVGQKQQESYSIANYVAKQDSLLHYATLESLRISPALSFSPPECTASEKVISGYHIPPKTPTVIDVRRLNTYPELWAPDPDEFRPERFENLAPSRYRYGLLRWGIGPGKCMGKNMADLLLKMTVSAVLERYSLSPAKAVDEKSGIKPGPGPAPTPINFKRI